MGGIHEIGSRGERLLAEYLVARGRTVTPSDRKTFDLIVDGRYAEVKTSDAPYAKLGFIGLTGAQYRELSSGTPFNLFVVCNARDPDRLEVIEFDAAELLKAKPKIECTYYWYRSHLDACRSTSTRVPELRPPTPATAASVHPESGALELRGHTSITAHVRRLAATDDADLYIRIGARDAERLNLRHGHRVQLDLGTVQVSGVVRSKGGEVWLAPGPGASNASISGALKDAGFAHGADVSALVGAAK